MVHKSYRLLVPPFRPLALYLDYLRQIDNLGFWILEIGKVFLELLAFLDDLPNELFAEWHVLLAFLEPFGLPEDEKRQQVGLKDVVQMVTFGQRCSLCFECLEKLGGDSLGFEDEAERPVDGCLHIRESKQVHHQQAPCPSGNVLPEILVDFEEGEFNFEGSL